MKTKTLKDVSDALWRIYFGNEKLTVFDKAKICPRNITLSSGVNHHIANYKGDNMVYMFFNDDIYKRSMVNPNMSEIVIVHEENILYNKYCIKTDDVLNDYQLFNTSTLLDNESTEIIRHVIEFEFRFDKIKQYIFDPYLVKGYLNEK
ncbi:hypothetical protein XaC1_85 [Xanthomonas phage XaC1]|nr:hypothetical protein XaC1_85 [Xanthomonas phage XaC1]